MDLKKGTLLKKAYTTFIDLMLNSNDPVDHLDKFVAEDIMAYGFTLDDKIHDLKGLKDLAILQRKQSAGMKFNYKLKPVFRKITNEDNTAIIVDELKITRQVEGENIELDLRLSTIMDFADGNWKVVHWHGSKPEYDSGRTDTWHKEEWKQKNEQLQKLVDEKTAELLKQNRELEIEAALEKVRTRSLAMHNTAELTEVLAVVYEKLIELNVDFDSANILIFSEHTKDIECWTINNARQKFQRFNLPYGDYSGPFEIANARQNKLELLELNFQGKAHDELLKYLFEESDFKNLPAERKKILKDSGNYTLSIGIGNRIGIEINSYYRKAFSDEENEIVQRFTTVFEQAYIRFLDLQKAEEQAREAKIEAALERVRARSMGMHKSEELVEVVRLLDKEIIGLGVEVNGSQIISDFTNPEEGVNVWYAREGQGFLKKFHIPYLEHPLTKRLYNALQNSIDFYTDNFSKDEKNKYFRLLFKYSDFGRIPIERQKFVYHSPAYIRAVAVSKNSILIFQRFDLKEFTKEEEGIFKRFGKVFEQAYTRFLDLQKAEAQAREAQIEAALERVRSRSLAMNQSDELQEVISVVFVQMQQLGIKADASLINILTEDSRDFYLWIGTVGQMYAQKIRIPYIEHPVFDVFYEARDRGESFMANALTREEKDSFFKYAFKYSDLKLMPEERKKYVMDSAGFARSFAWSKNSGITIQNYDGIPYSDQENEILKRLAQVFEQAYTRFLDVKNAEARAREAIKQASLDRVRGEIASMRTKDDLNRITPLIWKELNTLGVPFIRCGMFIMDEQNQHIHTFLSKPGGESIAAFYLPYSTPGNFAEMVKHWRQNKNYIHHWGEAEFRNLADILLQNGTITSHEQYMSNLPKGGIHLNFLPFLQGMLYVGNVEPLSSDQLHLVQTLSDAFSTAYARYEDFTKLEAAKNQVEHTLSELKATQSQLIQSEKMASLGELTAGIAHEIQNPLNFVNNFSEINSELIDELSEEVDNGNIDEVRAIANDIKENEQKINHHGKRADAIVKGMLQHSRTSTGQKEPTDINALANEYLRLSYHGLKAKDKTFNADFKTEFDESLPKINVIPQDIGRVLLNLINNAFYACTELQRDAIAETHGRASLHTPTVTVKTSYLPPSGASPDKSGGMRGAGAGGAVLISVSDNGPGIPSSIIDKIFQPFFTTKPTGSGTGLGLSLSYDIVKAHGGELKVESKEREGTEFTIILPAL